MDSDSQGIWILLPDFREHLTSDEFVYFDDHFKMTKSLVSYLTITFWLVRVKS